MHYMHYMHYKDYIHHDFYVYSPVLLTQYLGHCWHTPCTELYILRISAWLLRKPPLPCHRGGGTIWLGEGGGVGSLLIYIYIFTLCTFMYCMCNAFMSFSLSLSPLSLSTLHVHMDRYNRLLWTGRTQTFVHTPAQSPLLGHHLWHDVKMLKGRQLSDVPCLGIHTGHRSNFLLTVDQRLVTCIVQAP